MKGIYTQYIYNINIYIYIYIQIEDLLPLSLLVQQEVGVSVVTDSLQGVGSSGGGHVVAVAIGVAVYQVCL